METISQTSINVGGKSKKKYEGLALNCCRTDRLVIPYDGAWVEGVFLSTQEIDSSSQIIDKDNIKLIRRTLSEDRVEPIWNDKYLSELQSCKVENSNVFQPDGNEKYKGLALHCGRTDRLVIPYDGAWVEGLFLSIQEIDSNSRIIDKDNIKLIRRTLSEDRAEHCKCVSSNVLGNGDDTDHLCNSTQPISSCVSCEKESKIKYFPNESIPKIHDLFEDCVDINSASCDMSCEAVDDRKESNFCCISDNILVEGPTINGNEGDMYPKQDIIPFSREECSRVFDTKLSSNLGVSISTRGASMLKNCKVKGPPIQGFLGDSSSNSPGESVPMKLVLGGRKPMSTEFDGSRDMFDTSVDRLPTSSEKLMNNYLGDSMSLSSGLSGVGRLPFRSPNRFSKGNIERQISEKELSKAILDQNDSRESISRTLYYNVESNNDGAIAKSNRIIGPLYSNLLTTLTSVKGRSYKSNAKVVPFDERDSLDRHIYLQSG